MCLITDVVVGLAKGGLDSVFRINLNISSAYFPQNESRKFKS